MPESLSLNDLFKIGTSKEQLKALLGEIKENQDNYEQFSIFDDIDIDNNFDNIFGMIDKKGDGVIDEEDVLALKNKFQDENQNEISENDLKLLYQEMMLKKYSKQTPSQMYKTATNNVSDVRESRYIEDLDNSVSFYENFIDSRQRSSNTRIENYKDQIDNIVRRAASKKGIDTSKYDELTEKSKLTQREINSNKILLQQKQRELEAAQKEVKRLEKEIAELQSSAKKDDIEIDSRRQELNVAQNKVYNLSVDIRALKTANRTLENDAKKTNKKIAAIQKEILKNDKEAEQEVKSINKYIEQEKRSAEAEIRGYKDEISSMRNAREYAYDQMSATASQSADMDFHNDGRNVPSLRDVNYSAEKGQKLAQDIKSHAVGFRGYCSRHVSNALARTGLGNERAASAHMMDTKLDNNKNFQKISVSSADELRNLPAGCIIVYEAGAAGYNSQHGHIEVTLGDGTACSDGITRNIRYADRMSVYVPIA